MARYSHPTQEQVGVALATAPAYQPWRFEGHCRHRIRADLCLQGSSWNNADHTARRLVARARTLVNGTPAPRGWDYNVFDQFEDERQCARCERWFVARNETHLFCSTACHLRYNRAQGARLPRHLRCERCNEVLVDPRPGKKYCSWKCYRDAANARHRARYRNPAFDEVRICAAPGCTNQLPPDAYGKRIYCSNACNTAAYRARQKPNGIDASQHAERRGNGLGNGGAERQERQRVNKMRPELTVWSERIDGLQRRLQAIEAASIVARGHRDFEALETYRHQERVILAELEAIKAAEMAAIAGNGHDHPNGANGHEAPDNRPAAGFRPDDPGSRERRPTGGAGAGAGAP